MSAPERCAKVLDILPVVVGEAPEKERNCETVVGRGRSDCRHPGGVGFNTSLGHNTAPKFHALQHRDAFAEVGEKPSLFEGFQSLARVSRMGGNCTQVETDIIQICRGADTKQRFENLLHHSCKNGARCAKAHGKNLPDILSQRFVSC